VKLVSATDIWIEVQLQGIRTVPIQSLLNTLYPTVATLRRSRDHSVRKFRALPDHISDTEDCPEAPRDSLPPRMMVPAPVGDGCERVKRT